MSIRDKCRKLFRDKQWQKRRGRFQKAFFPKLSSSPTFGTTTIISSNCWGGMIYHDAGLRFLSPTINLTFEPEDFLCFVKHLDELQQASMVEDSSAEEAFPVGLLTYPSGRTIRIQFVHYRSFEEGETKFWERAKRMTNNIVVFFMTSQLTKEIYESFLNINYKKVCVYGNTDAIIDSRYSSMFLCFPKLITSKRDILSFKHLLGRQIIIDDLGFDWYSFAFGGK